MSLDDICSHVGTKSFVVGTPLINLLVACLRIFDYGRVHSSIITAQHFLDL